MSSQLEISALKVQQWLDGWNEVIFDDKKYRREPKPKYFYLFNISASLLKRLSKVYSRKASGKRIEDTGIQRKHDPERSKYIREYIFGGFPWSDLSKQKRKSAQYKDLKMPGWLPTAIIANILAPDSKRDNEIINPKDVIKIYEEKGLTKIVLPQEAKKSSWVPRVAPIEIIDGQHRLWAFEKDENLNGTYELPVVAFYNLDISWQAYLFYTINIKPKKINASLAYDLYPILRVQDWLENSPEGAHIYRETRAQELTEVLWAHDYSTWKNRINMLGEKKGGAVTQAAFVRSLIASFIKSKRGKSIGGIFGSLLDDDTPLPWNRTQQAGLLILAWRLIADAIKESEENWCKEIRDYYVNNPGKLSEETINEPDPGFASKYSLLATDQGVRGYLHIINDMLFVANDILELKTIQWPDEIKEDTIDHTEVKKAIRDFKKSKVNEFLKNIANELTAFDWRTSSFPRLSRDQQQKQMVFKGSSGYKELRKQLLEILSSSNDKLIKKMANEVLKRLKYVDK